MTVGLREQLGTLNSMYPLKQYFHSYALDSQESAYTSTGEINPELAGVYKINADAARKANYDHILANWDKWVAPFK